MSGKYQIEVSVESFFQEQHSDPERQQYVYAYRITISNAGSEPAKLLSRHWYITDANNEVQEVRGAGVVGENPHLAPGESFTYTSGAQLTTPYGSMRGTYQMQADDGTLFDAEIAEFHLLAPRTLH